MPGRSGRGAQIAALACLLVVTSACESRRTPTSPFCVPPPCPAALSPPPGNLPCYPAWELDEIDQEVTVRFEGDASAGALVCTEAGGSRDLTRIQARMYQALAYMKRARFDAPLPWTADELYSWFTTLVKGVRVRSDIPNAFAEMSEHVIDVLGTRDEAAGPESSFPSYVMVLVHEARHLQVGGHTCGTKDSTIAEMGANGTQYYLMVWIAQHDPGATLQERAYAQNQADSLRCSSFCRECR
jgi:hypothetical protein